MAAFDDLPADQKAVLQLVLRQGRTYDEIAKLLKISPSAVRDRALNALDALGPEDAGDLPPEQQDDVGDFLLGQQDAAQRASTKELLEHSPDARRWARDVAGALRDSGLAGDGGLPEIAAEPPDPVAAEAALGAPEPRRDAPRRSERSSRLGGILLLGGLALIVTLVVAVAAGWFNGGDSGDKATAGSSTTAAQTTSTTAGTQVEAQINLKPPSGGSKALGVANIVSQNSQRALAVIGQDLAASGHYVLWLRNGGKVKFLGFFPPVSGKGTSKGRLQGLVAAPSDLGSYNEILVSREPSSSPKQPTAIVLQGSITG